MTGPAGPRVAVAGAGITGLSAALELAERGAEVVLVDSDRRAGGKIRTGAVDGVRVEEGPDAFLSRVPEAVELCRRVGLGDELVPTGTDRAFVWSRGRMRPLPSGLVLGVPTDLWSLASSRLVGPVGLLRAGLDLVMPASPAAPGDRSVADIISSRLGRPVLERLVDPLVGGIYAGRAEHLSAAATTPQLEEASRRSRSLLLGLRAQLPAPGRGPTFMSLRGGLGSLVDRLVGHLAEGGHEMRWESEVRTLRRRGEGWHLETSSGDVVADAVVVTVPAPASAALMAEVAPEAAAELERIDHASVAVVSLVYAPNALDRPPAGSGFLVPRTEGRLLTACTWTSSKWPHLDAGERIVLRASAGRAGDDRALQMDDDNLTEAAHGELRLAMGLLHFPLAAKVSRWPGAFPQYEVGHLERVSRIEEAVGRVPGLALAGAALRGIGIPACIRQGTAAARLVLDQLSTRSRARATG